MLIRIGRITRINKGYICSSKCICFIFYEPIWFT